MYTCICNAIEEEELVDAARDHFRENSASPICEDLVNSLYQKITHKKCGVAKGFSCGTCAQRSMCSISKTVGKTEEVA